MNPKICAITGANTGIGLATAQKLAAMGLHLILICRNEEKGKIAQDNIKKASGNEQVDLLTCDLSSQAQIREMADKIQRNYPHLDILINNAGAMFWDLQYSEDNIEMQWAVNHFAPFLLTHLLVDSLKAAPGARVINVNSIMHRGGKLNFDDLYGEEKYDGIQAYKDSKFGSLLGSFEQAKRLKDVNITVNCLHPGGIDTEIAWKNTSGFKEKALKLFMGLFMKSPKKGAETSVFMATSPEVEGVTGKYYSKCKPDRSHWQSEDPELRAKVWELSIKMTGLDAV